TALEFVTIAAAVPRRKRTGGQRAMMRRAARHHGVQWGFALVGILLTLVALQWYLVRVRGAAEALVQAVLVASANEVPGAIEQLRPYSSAALPMLRERFGDP